MNRLVFLFSLIIASTFIASAQTAITPEPIECRWQKGNFNLNKNTIVIYDATTLDAKDFFIDYLKTYYDLELKCKTIKDDSQRDKQQNAIILSKENKTASTSEYKLSCKPNSIVISGSPEGVFYGIQTLIQLLPLNKQSIEVPAVEIFDAAQFSYRGLHLDVARHFFSIDFIKRYIDYLALHKMNVFHWHLTDDQGWRIEIKKFPRLTEIGSRRSQTLVGPYGTNHYDGIHYGGYYTQEEIKSIVQYAAKRFITVIPEIEMPGHCMAALASYPHLGCTKGPYDVMQTWGVSEDAFCAGNDSTYQFLEQVLDEILPLFPSKYIHIGGDECAKDRWQKCNVCLQKMKTENLPNEHALQSYFVGKIENYINSKGKKIIGWDEILEGGLAANATVMSWRGVDGGIAAAKLKHDVIMTPGTPLYFDHSQSINEDSITQGGYNSLQMVYEYNPIPSVLDSIFHKYIIGAQANMWTEYMGNEDKVEYMLFPRISGLSEALWCSPQNKNWNRFQKKIPTIFSRYDLWKINYSKAYYDIQTEVVTSKNNSIQWKLTTNNPTGMLFYETPNQKKEIRYSNAIDINEPGEYKAILKDNNNRNISSPVRQYFNINKATGKKIELQTKPNNSYANGGAFALVDGIQNARGMSKSAQFLGFWGDDLDATIDLGRPEKIHQVSLRTFEQEASWIYKPGDVVLYYSLDGVEFKNQLQPTVTTDSGHHLYGFACAFEAQFIRIVARNAGTIPEGKPGAGNKTWLFADEIEIK
jgi:hexosaminidase